MQNDKDVTILIFGDICPTEDTTSYFEKGDNNGLFNEIQEEISQSDIVVGNLECALTDNPKPIKKAGPILTAKTKCVTLLKNAGFEALGLANNHIRDCGGEGVTSTISSLEHNGIKAFGAGQNLMSAKQPLVIFKNGFKIGFVAFAEQEFNIATKIRPGAAYLDLYDDFDRIREFRSEVDYLIVLYHGGIEYFPYPSPELAKKCRKLIDCGADVVTCQHSHCIGTIEQYHDGTIVYGQGNSAFGYRRGNDSWNQGLLLKIDLKKTDSQIESKVSYIGITAAPDGLHLLDEASTKLLDKALSERALLITNREQLDKEWDAFCENLGKIHLPLLLGWPRLLIAVNRRINNLLVRLFYNQRKYNNTHNLIRCEAHKEVIDYLLAKKDFE